MHQNRAAHYRGDRHEVPLSDARRKWLDLGIHIEATFAGTNLLPWSRRSAMNRKRTRHTGVNDLLTFAHDVRSLTTVSTRCSAHANLDASTSSAAEAADADSSTRTATSTNDGIFNTFAEDRDVRQFSASASRRGTHARQSLGLLGPLPECADWSTPTCGSPSTLAYLQGGRSE